jgi:hypothetical protein
VDLPAEVGGLLRPVSQWSRIRLHRSRLDRKSA